MLELRPNCECCDADLPAAAAGAYICSFECTFCAECAMGEYQGACPNCGGQLTPRPTRTGATLSQHPGSTARVVKAHAHKPH